MDVAVRPNKTLFRLHDHIHVLADPRARLNRISRAQQLVHTASLYRGVRGVSLSDLVRYCGAKGFSEEQTLHAARELRDRGLARFTLTDELNSSARALLEPIRGCAAPDRLEGRAGAEGQGDLPRRRHLPISL